VDKDIPIHDGLPVILTFPVWNDCNKDESVSFIATDIVCVEAAHLHVPKENGPDEAPTEEIVDVTRIFSKIRSPISSTMSYQNIMDMWMEGLKQSFGHYGMNEHIEEIR